MIHGLAEMRRIGGWGFPVEELVAGNQRVAALGRDGSLRIFFGPGRRVRLADGEEWRIKAATSGRCIVPVITSPTGAVAISGPLHGKRCYGITGRDWAYFLIPLGRTGLFGTKQWAVRLHEADVGMIHDRVFRSYQPIPVAAALLAFTLITHGIPGEARLIPGRG